MINLGRQKNRKLIHGVDIYLFSRFSGTVGVDGVDYVTAY